MWTRWTGLLFTATCLLASTGFHFARGTDKNQQPKASLQIFVASSDPECRKSLRTVKNQIPATLAKGIEIAAIFPDATENAASVRNAARDSGFTSKTQIDLFGKIARENGIKESGTAIIRSDSGQILYKGPLTAPTASLGLKIAPQLLTSLVMQKKVSALNRSAPGFRFNWPKDIPSSTSTTYLRDVEPILRRSCVPCHSPGGAAPFSLTTPALAKKWAPMIQSVIQAGRMPPYKAVRGYLPLAHDRNVSANELETLRLWAEGGFITEASAGTSESPTDGRSVPDWKLGTPDAVLKHPLKYKVAPDRKEEYRLIPYTTSFSEDKWLRAIELKPGIKQVVHHVLIFIDPYRTSLTNDGADGQAGYTSDTGFGFVPTGMIGGWVPGTEPESMPPGTAIRIPKNAVIVLQIHYAHNGIEAVDDTQIGLYFADGPPKSEARVGFYLDQHLRIPAGESSYIGTSEVEIDEDIDIWGLLPHMHQLGKWMKIEAVQPDGKATTLLVADDWDFDWQLFYRLKQPFKLRSGGKLKLTARYDNSSENPHNPNRPPRRVVSGFRTTDEMMLLSYLYTRTNPEP